MIQVMCDILMCKNEGLAQSALKYIGGILGSNNQNAIEKLMFNGVIDKLTSLCYSARHQIVKECCWAFSNLTASGIQYAQAFVKSSAFSRICILAMNDNIDTR